MTRLLSLAINLAACAAWTAPRAPRTPLAGAVRPPSSHGRRDFLARSVAGAAAAAFAPPPAAAAASQEQRDRENIVRGYNRLQYFLDHWEDETTVCSMGQEVRALRRSLSPVDAAASPRRTSDNAFTCSDQHDTSRPPLGTSASARPSR